MAGKRRQFTPEFKLEAVRLAKSKKPLSQWPGSWGFVPRCCARGSGRPRVEPGRLPGTYFRATAR